MELRVVVCASPAAGQVLVVEVTLPSGSCVADALDASGLVLPLDAPCGLWGGAVPRDALLRDGDRVEVYRPLAVDPKEARRLRYRRSPQRHRKLGQKGGPQPG